MDTIKLLHLTRNSIKDIKGTSCETRQKMINSMADALMQDKDEILKANEKDIKNAQSTISSVMIDRLKLNEERLSSMAEGMRKIASLEDPLGKELDREVRPNGLVIKKVSSPLGLVAIIYESRPNVTSDAACLSLKSGNVCILRVGKEAYFSAEAIVKALKRGIKNVGINENILNLVSDTTRESATCLMKAKGLVDLLIPRGGKGLISACVENAIVPCIQTGTGICHIYIDKDADISLALDIVENAKVSRPSVCNALEVCLVHKDIANTFLPLLKERLVNKRASEGNTPVELRLCEKALEIIPGTPSSAEDFDTEFLDYILAVKVLNDVDDAIEHILYHSTGHSEAIITKNPLAAQKFADETDSAAVYINASTRFTDGGEFGMGCEMGISTQKLHARGPMGLKELTTYKYVIEGTGQIR